jgi:ATP-dependent DNA helicase RecG
VPSCESDTVEFKQQWTEKALKDLAAFANTRGGRLFVGVRDDGTIAGVDPGDAHQRLVANQIDTKLHIAADIQIWRRRSTCLLVITVPLAPRLVRLNGRYYWRMGTTCIEMPDSDVAERLRQQSGRTWDEAPAVSNIGDIHVEHVRAFVRSAARRTPSRLPVGVGEHDPVPLILGNLDLLVDHRPTNAAVLLFGRNPQRHMRGARIRAGFFRGVNDFDQFTDCTGPIFAQVEAVLRQIASAFPTRLTFPALREGSARRIETESYPEVALLEALVNAVVHRDYEQPGVEVEVKMYPDHISVWNPGGLLPGMTLRDLTAAPHPSARRNPLIAQIAFIDHWVERYGTGTTRMIQACRASGLPDPEFTERAGGFQVVLRRDIWTPDRLASVGLNPRQITAVMFIKTRGVISNAEYQRLIGVSKRTATNDLRRLVAAGILFQIGHRGRSTHYLLAPRPSPSAEQLKGH